MKKQLKIQISPLFVIFFSLVCKEKYYWISSQWELFVVNAKFSYFKFNFQWYKIYDLKLSFKRSNSVKIQNVNFEIAKVYIVVYLLLTSNDSIFQNVFTNQITGSINFVSVYLNLSHLALYFIFYLFLFVFLILLLWGWCK